MVKKLVSKGGLSHLNLKTPITEKDESVLSVNNNTLDKKSAPKLHPRSFRLSLEDQDLLRELTKKLDSEVRMNINDTIVIKSLIRLAHKTDTDTIISSLKETLL